MMRPEDSLSELLEAFRRMTGAARAAALLHLEPLDRDTLLLVGPGAEPAVPELSSEDAAWEFVSSHAGHGKDSVAIVPSTDPEGTLVHVSVRGILPQPRSARRSVNERRSQPVVTTAPNLDGGIWIGLQGSERVAEVVEELNRADGESADWLGSLTGVCLRLAWSIYHLASLMQDPVSRLPGRMELQVFLKRAIAAAAEHDQSIALMLVNPDDFTMINHRYGRGHGDLAVREIAQKLHRCLRRTDRVFHYGGAVFAAVLPATDVHQCRATAEKLRRELAAHRYVDGTIALTFSIGIAVAGPKDLDGNEAGEALLARRADAALNSARLSGGARIVVTPMNLDDEVAGSQMKPLSGIFGADTEKDYRNMLLLWETVALISTQSAPESIAAAFVDRLAIGFRPQRIAIVTFNEAEIEIMASNVRDEGAADGRASGRAFDLPEASRTLVLEALETRQVARLGSHDRNESGLSAYAVPLMARENALGCLYLDARAGELRLDSSDVIFLTALAAQMAVAIDRADLATRWIKEKDRESRSLRQEVWGLRQALQHTKLVYQSAAMHGIMDTLRKVAPSDATVLIFGESGTGKEMLARSLHELSDRRKAPYVVFDCGAVAHSLLEAELFGHRKGAFTGAERNSPGRIIQADGGTLFLDEIGELPLELQAKLLRFVQEKEYAPVGSSETRRVDVRIVAATNRALQDEVRAGRFRADLYYRLRVIAVQAVPLRERTDDILPLARYFMEKFAAQQGAPTHRLSAAAERKLLQYRWPGNVRELQNCMLRAVLTGDSELLDADSIDLCPESLGDESHGLVHAANSGLGSEIVARGPVPQHPEDDPWKALAGELERQVSSALASRRRPAPIGRWLSEDLVLTASELTDNVARRAAQLVNMPESTYRRQFDKASSGAFTGMDYRPEDWAPVRPLIRRVLQHAERSPLPRQNLLERARTELLTCVRDVAAARPGTGASLMGVTPPTYKRWLQSQDRCHE